MDDSILYESGPGDSLDKAGAGFLTVSGRVSRTCSPLPDSETFKMWTVLRMGQGSLLAEACGGDPCGFASDVEALPCPLTTHECCELRDTSRAEALPLDDLYLVTLYLVAAPQRLAPCTDWPGGCSVDHARPPQAAAVSIVQHRLPSLRPPTTCPLPSYPPYIYTTEDSSHRHPAARAGRGHAPTPDLTCLLAQQLAKRL